MAKPTVGVYAIRNQVTGRTYVGSSWDVPTRIAAHRSCLRRGVHDNRLLQREWVAFGESAFVFEQLESIDPERLGEQERHWLTLFATRPGGVYNAKTPAARTAPIPSRDPSQPIGRKAAVTPDGVYALRRHRLWHVWTVRDLATAAGVSQQSVTNAERGTPVNARTMDKIAAALGVPASDIAEFTATEAA